MALTVTDAACARVRALVTKQDPPCSAPWLRLAVQSGGCSGLSYELDFVAAPHDKDKRFEFGDIRLCVDRRAYLFVNGTELDYQEDLVQQAFVFNNPLATRSCSCGESFTV